MKFADAVGNGKSNLFSEATSGLLSAAVEAAREGQDLHKTERLVLDWLLILGRLAMDVFFELQGNGDLGATVESIEGEVAHRSSEPVMRVLRTLFGLHEFPAYVYRERQHPHSSIVLRPIDARLGVSPVEWSPLLQEFSQLFAVDQAYGQVAENLERIFRQQLSVDTVERVNQQMGIEAAILIDELPIPPKSEEGEVLVTTSDAKGVPLVKEAAARLAAFEEPLVRPGNRRMATLAGVYSVDRHYRTPEEILAALFRDPQEGLSPKHRDRPEPCHKRVIARFAAPIPEFDPNVTVSGAVHALGWAAEQVHQRRRPGQDLVCLIDGQASLWETLDNSLGDGESAARWEILDITHVSSYVWKAAKALNSQEQHQVAFARHNLLRILQGETKQVVTHIRRLATRQKLNGTAKKEVATVCRYFTTHRHRMRYDEYLSKGFPIATGVIEGACRHLVKDRMERSGMRWTQENAQAMLDVRAIHQSSYWDDLQERRVATARSRYAPYLHLIADIKTVPA
jgi:hypothetical protein